MLNDIFESDLMKHYIRQSQFRQLAEPHEAAGSLSTKNAAEKAKIEALKTKVIYADIQKLKKELTEVEGLHDDTQGRLESLEQHKLDFESSIETMTQSNTESAQKIQEKEQELAEF